MKLKTRLIILFVLIVVSFNIFIYIFDKTVMPTVIAVAEGEMRAKAIVTVNNCILKEFNKSFDYDKVIKVEKDNSGNIVMLKADTLKLNEIACNVALQSQWDLKQLGSMGIKIPISYITKNNILSSYGPGISVKMYPIGNIETKYYSTFESAGINQTRHRIFVEVRTQIRVIIPFKRSDIEVVHQIPICETIIVGKVPDNAINLDMNGSGFSLPNN
ncbi:sporulation protein YunB [Clostridium thermarum]|uniref:sporulation protein YunB n=1 Tax=Clostridium thermarum TaxID=1716543 RepID=UPI0013D3AEBE|nr:sporulation protein YunB [Clostridium thermarum]